GPCDRGHSGELDRIPIPRHGRLALAEELARAGGIGFEPLQVAVIKAAQNRSLLRVGRAVQGTVEYPFDARCECCAAVSDSMLRKNARGFDENRIVQKIQS